MSLADALILTVVILIMLAIIFFTLIFPRITHRTGKCSYCPVAKERKIKRAFKDYKKEKNKDNK